MQRHSIPLHQFWQPAARRALALWPTMLAVLLCVLLSGASVSGQAEDLVSPLTGLTLPEGAQKVEEKSALAQAHTLLEKLAGSGKRVGRIEVYLWTQEAEARQTEMDAVLQKHADSYKKLPRKEINGIPLTVFAAGFKERKLACLGLWINNGPQLVLALGEVLNAEGSIPNQPTGEENKKVVRRELNFPKLTRKPGIVQGTVLDRNGKPMPDVVVTLWFALPSFDIFHHTDILKIITDASGHYEVNVKETSALGHIDAAMNMQYNGRNCKMPFDRREATGRQRLNDYINRAEGDIVNFTTAISGLRGIDQDLDNSNSYYGSTIIVRSDITRTRYHALPPGTKMHVVLTPRGPLLDGSTGQTMTVDIPANFTTIHPYEWKDIPIGDYFFVATLIQPGRAALPLEATLHFPFSGTPLRMDAQTPLYFQANGNGGFNWVDMEVLIP